MDGTPQMASCLLHTKDYAVVRTAYCDAHSHSRLACGMPRPWRAVDNAALSSCWLLLRGIVHTLYIVLALPASIEGCIVQSVSR